MNKKFFKDLKAKCVKVEIMYDNIPSKPYKPDTRTKLQRKMKITPTHGDIFLKILKDYISKTPNKYPAITKKYQEMYLLMKLQFPDHFADVSGTYEKAMEDYNKELEEYKNKDVMLNKAWDLDDEVQKEWNDFLTELDIKETFTKDESRILNSLIEAGIVGSWSLTVDKAATKFNYRMIIRTLNEIGF